jgi:hypothetical protein
MAGGAELEQLSHELEGVGGAAAEIAHEMEDDVVELGLDNQPSAGSNTGSNTGSSAGTVT